jgi:outer membrane protein TolC
MNRFLISSLFLIVFFSVRLTAQEAVPESAPALTLEEATRIALDNNRSTKNAALASSIAADQIAEARTYRFPSIKLYALGSELLAPVNFDFQRGIFGTFPGIGPVPAQNTQIESSLRPTFYGVTQIVQPLSQQYKIGLNVQLAKLGQALNDERLRAQKHAVVDQVKQAYYGLLSTQSALEVNRETLKLDRELGRLVQQQVEQGEALKADAMDIQAKLAQEEYNQQSLNDALSTQKEQLNQLLGRDVRTDFAVGTIAEASAMEVDLEAARAKALASRPELRETRMAVQQAEISRRITKSGYIPDVSLAVNDLSLANVNPMLPSNVASAGILITWDPIDWGRRKHQLAEAAKSIEQSKNSVNDAEAQVLIEVGETFRKVGQTRSLLHATDLALASARERLRVTMHEYEQKAALLKDVLQQKTAVQNATDQYQHALISFWDAKADFERALGED